MSMSIRLVRVNEPGDLVPLAKSSIRDGTSYLFLFDEGGMANLHDSLLSCLREGIAEEEGFVVWLPGHSVTTKEGFYAECRRAVPSASYMGSNLDALQDIFRGEALSRNREQRTYWIWSHADMLFQGDCAFFVRAFESLIFCAKEIGEGMQNAYRQEFIPPRQKVTLIMTGQWSILGSEASREDSFTHALKQTSSLRAFPDDRTGVQVIRVQPSSLPRP